MHPAGMKFKEDFVMQFRTDNFNTYEVAKLTVGRCFGYIIKPAG